MAESLLVGLRDGVMVSPAQWAWWSTQTGTVQFRLVMLRGPDGGKFQVAFGDQKFEVNLDPSSNNAREEIVGEFNVLQKGKQDVELTCLDGESDCKFLWIEIYGEPVTGGSVIRKVGGRLQLTLASPHPVPIVQSVCG